MGVRPPNVKESWDENDVITRAEIIAYEQVRSKEDTEAMALCASVQQLPS